MLTWSSLLAEVGMESTLAGEARTLFSDTSDAATIWRIPYPQLTPGSCVREGGRPLSWGLTSRAMRRSEMLASSARAIPRKSMAKATGSP